VSVTDTRQDNDPDRLDAHEESAVRGAVEQRQYSRPQAFFIGPATSLVRGGLYGKAQDGYNGHYMEP
jgi:hypothetical protein